MNNLKRFVHDAPMAFYRLKAEDIKSKHSTVVYKKEQVVPELISDGDSIRVAPFKAGEKLASLGCKMDLDLVNSANM